MADDFGIKPKRLANENASGRLTTGPPTKVMHIDESSVTIDSFSQDPHSTEELWLRHSERNASANGIEAVTEAENQQKSLDHTVDENMSQTDPKKGIA
jgi:hypothetical protein